MGEVPAQPQPQVTNPKSTNWKKVGLTIVFIVACVSIISGIYWFMVVNKSSGDSDLTGPVPKVTTKTSTESAKEATASTEKDETANWKVYTNSKYNYTVKYPPTWVVDDRGPFDPGCGGQPYKDVVQLFIHDDPNLKCIPISTHGYQMFNIQLGQPHDLSKYSAGSKRGCEGAAEVEPNIIDTTTKFKLDSIDAVKITRNYNNCVGYVANTAVLFNYKNKGFNVYIPVNDDGKSDEVYDQILSTFKFLD